MADRVELFAERLMTDIDRVFNNAERVSRRNYNGAVVFLPDDWDYFNFKLKELIAERLEGCE